MIVATLPVRLGLALLLLLAGCGEAGSGEERGADRTATPFPTVARLMLTPEDGSPVTLEVAVADTQGERQRGLMGVEHLPENAGMVFLHDGPSASGFWMKNTLIPLSVAVWDESGTILQIVDMEPCREDPCEVYGFDHEWVGAVEANQGFFEDHGIRAGATVSLEGTADPGYGAPSA